MLIVIALFVFVLVVGMGSLVSGQDSDAYLAEQQKVLERFENYLNNRDKNSLKSLIDTYSSSELFNPFVGFHLVGQMLGHGDLLDLAEALNTKSIATNSSEHLAKFSAGMDNKLKEDWMYKELYSQRAWIRFKAKRNEAAREDIQQAIAYRDRHIQPTADGKIDLSADDLLRLGIISYGLGEHEYGWFKIAEGLVRDSTVVHKDPAYQVALQRILEDKYGVAADLPQVMARLHNRAKGPLPELGLVSLEGDPVRLQKKKKNVLFINFFSPICGSCQQEIAHLKGLSEKYAGGDQVDFFFVLNRPDLEEKAIRLFERNKIAAPFIVKQKRGRADFIRGEPTTWIVNRQGIIVARHIGYVEGDEQRYERELAQALEVE